MSGAMEATPEASPVYERLSPYSSGMQLTFGGDNLRDLKKKFAPDYLGFTEEMWGKSQIETDRTSAGSALSEEVFPPARYITLEEIAAEKSKTKKDYVDLTGEQPDKKEVEKIQQMLKELLRPANGKKNYLEGEVTVDPL